ncbi:MAG: hypothetical protein RL514_158 [Verrucomicrobiota bacterium]|jgi:hypothetical protein
MNLTDAQKQQISTWLEQGLKVADVQKKMAAELGVTMTYMEVRFLLDDLRLKPKDPEPPKTPEPAAPAAPDAAALASPEALAAVPAAGPTALGTVKMAVDTLARPGTVVSGKVTFSDGQTADWYLDQMGRMGVVPAQKGYKPSQPDVMEFQDLLQLELQKLGF